MKIHITVKNQNNQDLYCKIAITCLTSGTEQYIKTVYCAGFYTFALEKGLYEIIITRGKLYIPFKKRIEIKNDDIKINALLTEIINPKSMGLFSFDAHSHVSRDCGLTTGNLRTASTVMRGEAFDFFIAGSPYDNETHMEYIHDSFNNITYRQRFTKDIQNINDKDFMVDIGNELIKCRYGHVFMMNYTQAPPFSQYYDRVFDPWQFNKKSREPDYEIDYIFQAIMKEREKNSVAVAAHPTSWWWENGEFITNIAATIGFELATGAIDAMVIMGYEREHRHYQELWLDALRNGYFIPGIAETDASFDTIPDKFLEFKTYTQSDEFTLDALCKGIKAGKNIVSSGPLLMLNVNGNGPGAVIPFDNREPVSIAVSATACCQAPLSRAQLLINGTVVKEWGICQNNFHHEESFRLTEQSFIIAKCYDFEGNVAITNPVYIRNTAFANRKYPVETLIRLFEMPELQAIFRNLYLGGFNHDKKYLPGEVPAEAFQIKKIKEIVNAACI
jgi:hypothetical protein